MMKRVLNRLADNTFDLVVIGGGINGVCIAWDSVLRGLSVALIEKGDFGAATSANSLKIIHGGLRYLQSLDLARMRKSILDRSILARLAPHLVHPMPFMVPTYGELKNSRMLLRVALKVNDWVGFDRDHWTGGAAKVPLGRLVSRGEVLEVFPHVETKGLTGGAIWYDCFVQNSERLTLAFLRSAAAKGAVVANYAEAVELRVRDGRVSRVRVVDRLSGDELDVRGRVVVNAAGPWVDEVVGRCSSAAAGSVEACNAKVLAINMISRKSLTRAPIGVRSRPGSRSDSVMGAGRFLFLVPWRGRTMIGTSYPRIIDSPDECELDEQDLQSFVDECKAACPGIDLSASDITFVHKGALPLKCGGRGSNRLGGVATEPVITDRWSPGGVENLISVVGVKYTTARSVAQEVVDRVFQKLDVKRAPACATSRVSLSAEPEIPSSRNDSSPAGHGGQELFHDVMAVSEGRPPAETGCGVVLGEVLRAVRHEMAVRLSDVVLRRTELGTAGCPPPDAVQATADIMARELGWTRERRESEISSLMKTFERMKGLA